MKNAFVLLFAFACLISFSCKKRAPLCTGNCASITVSGKVIDKLTGTGAPNVAVSLNWSNSVWRLNDLVIGKVHSRNDGTFNFTTDIDTSYFSNRYWLSLYVDGNKQYLILGYSGLISLRTYSFNPSIFQGVQFEVYKEADLKIKLHRNQTDNFTNFSISHSDVVNGLFLYDYNVGSPKEVTDMNKTELNVSAVSGVFTKIRTMKTSGGTTVTTIDSIKCTAGATSVYDVYF
jgi:hypothetical protein